MENRSWSERRPLCARLPSCPFKPPNSFLPGLPGLSPSNRVPGQEEFFFAVLSIFASFFAPYYLQVILSIENLTPIRNFIISPILVIFSISQVPKAQGSFVWLREVHPRPPPTRRQPDFLHSIDFPALVILANVL